MRSPLWRALVATLLLASCGGGSSSLPTAAAPPTTLPPFPQLQGSYSGTFREEGFFLPENRKFTGFLCSNLRLEITGQAGGAFTGRSCCVSSGGCGIGFATFDGEISTDGTLRFHDTNRPPAAPCTEVPDSLEWRGRFAGTQISASRSRLVDCPDIGTHERRDETIEVTRN